jgi:hypothetical protein
MDIYKITNIINGKIYIGKDTTSNPNYYGSGKLIKLSIKKYGKENFTKDILDVSDDYNELSDKEKYWINFYKSTDRNIGYNISFGGDGGNTLTNHPNINQIREKISKNNSKKGKTYEEVFGFEKSKQFKDKLRSHIHKSILSEESIKKHKERWNLYRENLKNRCEFIKNEIKKGNVDNYIDELRKIRSNTSTNIFKSKESFYEFFGFDIKNKINLNNNPKPKKDKIIKKVVKKDHSVIIDNSIYESTNKASIELGLSRSLVKYRLKSPLYQNYKYNDETKNKNITKEPYQNNRKKISIDGIIYDSIKESSTKLDIPTHSIYHRLKSTSYPDWFYINNKEKIFMGEKKKKKVMVLGVIYESIADATKGSGINRELIRYRLKNDKFVNYRYI